MKRGLALVLSGLAIVALQAALRSFFAPSLFAPNLVLPLIIFLAFYHKSSWGVFISFLIGLEYDLFASRTLLGPNAGAFAVVYGLVACFSQRLFLESFVTVALTALVSSFVSQGIYLLFVSQFVALGTADSLLLGLSLPESITTALLSPILFYLFKRISEWIPGGTSRVTDRPRRRSFGRYSRVL